MVTRSADDGSCRLLAIASYKAPEASNGRSRVQPQLARRVSRYLRKTARGASSPAKPALHIPELPIVSSRPLYSYTLRAAVERPLRRRDDVGALDADSPSTAGMAVFGIGGVANSPIVDDESCDFLCSGRARLAELIEIDATTDEDGHGTAR